MTDFSLNEKLELDCHILGELNGQILLLMNNALVPWFILVPKAKEIEIYLSSEAEQKILYKNIQLLSEHIKEHFASEKLNIAAIGNVVSQLHIHIVGRNKNDFC